MSEHFVQGSFMDTECGFPLAWNKSPGKGLQRAAAWHQDVLTGEMHDWIEVRRERYKDEQFRFVDAITEAIMPIFRGLSIQAGMILSHVCRHFRIGIRPIDLSEGVRVKETTCSVQLGRMKRVGLLKRTDTGLYYMPTLDVLRVWVIRCDNGFGSYLRRINHVDGPTAMDDYIAETEKGLING